MARPPKIDLEVLIELLLQDKNQNEVAAYFDVTRQAVSDFMKRHNVTREVKRAEAMKLYPWDTGVRFNDAWENRLVRDHMEFMATGGEGLQPWKLDRLRAFYRRLTNENVVVEFDPTIPPSDAKGSGGFAYRPREERDADLIIRVNEYTVLTEEGKKFLALPAELP